LLLPAPKGIGRYLAQYYHDRGFQVFGCSRQPGEFGDDANVVDFFIKPECDLITGQMIY